MRSSLALIATAGLVAVVLSGCAAAAPQVSPGQSSDVVTVSGKFGDEPRVEFPTPLAPSTTQCTEVIAGEGELLQEGQFVLLGASIFNGTTGDQVQVVGYGDNAAPLAMGGSETPIAFTKGLTCAREGSRVVIVAPSEELILPGQDPEGAEGGDSIVAVFDVQRAFPARATGTPQLTRDGFPAVVLAPDGRPGITVPGNDPPTDEESEVEVLKRGAGEIVEDGDEVVVQFTGVTWADGGVFSSTWEKDAPTTLTVGGAESQVVAGFSKAVIGQKVGSQVAVIVPPSEGYGDQDQQKIPAGSTLFFVIDILGTY